MFEHLKFIPQAHRIALEAAIRNHNVRTGINPALLGKLYECALTGLDKPVQEDAFYLSTIKADQALISTATSKENGIYLQLALFPGQKNACLTLGQKWCLEGHDKIQGNNAIVYW